MSRLACLTITLVDGDFVAGDIVEINRLEKLLSINSNVIRFLINMSSPLPLQSDSAQKTNRVSVVKLLV